MAVLTLTDAERDRLRGLARRSDDRHVMHRALSLLDLDAGSAPRAIAARLGVARSTVYGWAAPLPRRARPDPVAARPTGCRPVARAAADVEAALASDPRATGPHPLDGAAARGSPQAGGRPRRQRHHDAPGVTDQTSDTPRDRLDRPGHGVGMRENRAGSPRLSERPFIWTSYQPSLPCCTELHSRTTEGMFSSKEACKIASNALEAQVGPEAAEAFRSRYEPNCNDLVLPAYASSAWTRSTSTSRRG